MHYWSLWVQVEQTVLASSPRSSGSCEFVSLLATRLNLILEDHSCGDVMSPHLLKPWSDISSQIGAVNSDTKLVTITVGDNDLNYVGDLFTESFTEGERLTYRGKNRPRPQCRCAFYGPYRM